MHQLLIQTGRIFYGLAIIIYGLQQFMYGDFRDVLFPPWQHQLPWLPMWAYLFGTYLLASGLWIVRGKNAKSVLLLLGGTFLFIFCFLQIPYELISQPHKTYHLGLWVSPLKELALAGGSFILAGNHFGLAESLQKKITLLSILDKIIPYGSLFFSITMISFGITHFMYAETVSAMVPGWVPDPLFWNYFAAVALIGSGVFIILDIRLRIIALLLGVMILSWVFLLHLPAAFSDPLVDRGNNVSSTFDALAFSGTAFVLAFGLKRKTWINLLDHPETHS